MNNSVLDVIIVGAGCAGLSTSYYLKESGLEHRIFERGRIGESWRSQRWDTFKFNTTNKLNGLPGKEYEPGDADGFCSAPAYISWLQEYVAAFKLPVVENSTVISVEKPGEFFEVLVSSAGVLKQHLCRQVVIASGHSNEINIPGFALNLPAGIKQLHTSQYRNARQLPAGAVLVAGSAQSGCQIAEDLTDAGRKVFLSTSMVARLPRRYRGRDIMDWLIELKFFDITAEQVDDPKMLHMRTPQLTGIGDGTKTISLQSLAKKGVVIVGKMDHADDQHVYFQANAAMHIQFADEFSKKVKEMIDGFILKNKLIAAAPDRDEEDMPDPEAYCASKITSLNVTGENISSIIWATGFTADHSYIKLPVFDDHGELKHISGTTGVPGLYFVGYPWLRDRKSVILFGIKEDAAFIAGKVCDFSMKDVLSVSA